MIIIHTFEAGFQQNRVDCFKGGKSTANTHIFYYEIKVCKLGYAPQFGLIFFLMISTVLRTLSDFAISLVIFLQPWIMVV